MKKLITGSVLFATLFGAGLTLGLSTQSARATDDCVARCMMGELWVCCGNQCFENGPC